MAAIDGLSSGLDTTSIIKQLMQLEKQPQLRLQSRQSATESAILTLRTLNTKFLTISTATGRFGATVAGSPTPATPPTTDWQLTAASSSDATRATVSAVSGAPASSLAINVRQLATTASYLGKATYTATTALSAQAQPFSKTTAPTTVTLQRGAEAAVTIDTGDGSLSAMVAGINSSGAGVTASTVQVEAGVYRLQLTATSTGAGAITLTRSPADATDDAFAAASSVAGQDAELVLSGSKLVVTRASNTISDVLEGVTLTLTKADSTSTPDRLSFVEPALAVAVKKDAEAIAAKISALVDAANGARAEAKSLTAFDPTTKAKGRLYGDSGVRGLVDRVRAAIVDGDAEVGLAGVTVGRDGTISFDKAKFLERLSKEPAKVEAALGADGMAGRLHTLADEVSRTGSATGGPGLLVGSIKSRESQIANLKDGIASWDVRLALKERMLQREYTALETALGKARSQGSWLAGQLANLPGMSS